jgi:hypothetical protein
VEYLKSLGLLVVGIFKRVYTLLPAFLSDPYDILERWFGLTIEAPNWLSWLLLSLGLLVSASLAYHEVRMRSVGLELDLARKDKLISAPNRVLRPKKRLGYYDKMAITQIEELMQRQHGHCDIDVINAEVLSDKTISEIMDSDCTMCGKPRSGTGGDA